MSTLDEVATKLTFYGDILTSGRDDTAEKGGEMKGNFKPIVRLWRREGRRWKEVETQPAQFYQDGSATCELFHRQLEMGVTWKLNFREENGRWEKPLIFHVNERGERVAGEI